ncbi:MAG: hypothetical protein IT168_16570 [Bryobacterales bacterium]|nr:hypothetical protein [Bryobacterales bacterium]
MPTHRPPIRSVAWRWHFGRSCGNELYADHPMDLADASLVAAAEALETLKVFTIDRSDFETYRARRGHRHYAMQIVC